MRCSAEVAANVAVKGETTEDDDEERSGASVLGVSPILAGTVLAGMAEMAL